MAKLNLCLHFEDGKQITQEINLPAILGRSKSSDLILNSWRIAKQHAKIIDKKGEPWLEDLGSILGTWVNGKRVAVYGPLKQSDEIIIGNCLVKIQAKSNTVNQKTDFNYEQELSEPESLLNESAQTLAASKAVLNNTTTIISEPVQTAAIKNESKPAAKTSQAQAISTAHLERLHASLISALQLKRHDISAMSDATLRFEARQALVEIINQDQELPLDIDKELLTKQLLAEAVGLGPLEELLKDSSVSEIMVNRYDEIFVERAGKLIQTNTTFSSEQAVLGVIERIVAPIGRRIDDSSPMVDARLKDGSRVNAVIAPLALRGASLTIRKFPRQRLQIQDLLRVGALDSCMATFLNSCVIHKKNILISGGTGSGKTSLLNILSNAIPNLERIITIEDAAELRLNHQHQVNLEARPANAEGRGQIVIRDLVRNALRMRPDRIVVGECRGAEAFDMLAAMNTGHEGSLTTLHANNPRDALARLETMILMAGMDLPLNAIREHIASAIDIIVQLIRTTDGRRLISSIVQLTGLENNRFLLQELFFAKAGPPAQFQGCHLMPEGFNHVSDVSLDMFSQTTQIQGTASL